MNPDEPGRTDHQASPGDSQADHPKYGSSATTDKPLFQPVEADDRETGSQQQKEDAKKSTRTAIEWNWNTAFQGILAAAAIDAAPPNEVPARSTAAASVDENAQVSPWRAGFSGWRRA